MELKLSNTRLESFGSICSNRTFMELKLSKIGNPKRPTHRSNRTFMELKYMLPDILQKDFWF